MSFEYIEKGEGSTTLFVLHYMTGTQDSMGFLLEGEGLRLIFPQGKYPSGFEEGGYSWFIGEKEFYDWTDEKQLPSILDTTHELAAFIKEIAPSQKCIVTGMSQGGDLSLMLAAYYPELISLSIPAAGRLFPPQDFAGKGRELPIVHVQHGQADEIVPVKYARDANVWLRANGYETTLSVYPDVGHDYSEEMVLHIRKLVAENTR